MFGFLKNLFGGLTQPKSHNAEPIEHKGFQIIATPRQVSGGWSTQGVIQKHIDGVQKEVTFIRADTCMSAEDAVMISQDKGRKIIDESGEQVFERERA